MAKFEDVYRKMVQEQAQPEAVEETAETIVEEVEEAVITEVKKESKAKEEFPPKKDDEEDDEDEKKKKNGDDVEEDDHEEDDEDEKKKKDDDEEKVEKKESTKKESTKKEAVKKEAVAKEKVETKEAVKKENADIPRTKNGILKAVYGKMEGIKKEHLAQAYNAILASFDKIKEDGKNGDDEKKKKVDVDVKEHMSALFHGEEELSEGFKEKAEVIFEAAVRSKIDSEIDRLETEYSTELNDAMQQSTEELTEKVDQYLDYVVSEWMKDNEVAVERGVKSELTEDFIKGLKNLFTDHYIEVPENKEDVLAGFADKCQDLENKLNEQIKKNTEMKQELNESRKAEILRDVSDGLAETEVEKLRGLSKSIQYDSDAQYRDQLSVVKENYFPKQTVAVADTAAEEASGNDTHAEMPSSMARYASSIRTMTSQDIYEN